MSVGFKQLYSGEEDERGRYLWQAEMPKDLGKVAEDAESEKWVVIVRRRVLVSMVIPNVFWPSTPLLSRVP